MECSESPDELPENFQGKPQFIASALGPFQINMHLRWNDPGILLLCHNRLFDDNKNRNILDGWLLVPCVSASRQVTVPARLACASHLALVLRNLTLLTIFEKTRCANYFL